MAGAPSGWPPDDWRRPHRSAGPLRWYPPGWRDRYGEEFLAFLEDRYGPGPLPFGARWSLWTGGMRERARHAGLIGDRLPVTDRVRAGVLVVLGAWTAFVVAAMSFAKFSEGFHSASPADTVAGAHGALGVGSPWIANAAFTLLEVIGGLSAAAVVGGAALAVPAFWRFLRSGGWPDIRGPVVRAALTTVALVVVTVPLLHWAHHLTVAQRNGALPGYGVLLAGWGALVVLCLVLWSAAAIAAARRMDIPWVVLFFQAMVAVAVAAAMVVMLVLTAVWWGAVAADAPWALQLAGSPGGEAWQAGYRSVPLYLGPQGGAWNLWLAGTVGLMVASAAGGLVGALRIAGVWSTSRREA